MTNRRSKVVQIRRKRTDSARTQAPADSGAPGATSISRRPAVGIPSVGVSGRSARCPVAVVAPMAFDFALFRTFMRGDAGRRWRHRPDADERTCPKWREVLGGSCRRAPVARVPVRSQHRTVESTVSEPQAAAFDIPQVSEYPWRNPRVRGRSRVIDSSPSRGWPGRRAARSCAARPGTPVARSRTRCRRSVCAPAYACGRIAKP